MIPWVDLGVGLMPKIVFFRIQIAMLHIRGNEAYNNMLAMIFSLFLFVFLKLPI